MKDEMLKIIDSAEWSDLKDKALAEAVVFKLVDGLGFSALKPLELRTIKEAGIYEKFYKTYYNFNTKQL